MPHKRNLESENDFLSSIVAKLAKLAKKMAWQTVAVQPLGPLGISLTQVQ